MPKGVYIKTEEHKRKLSEVAKGKKPNNKGIQDPRKLKKIERFKAGLSISCKLHGEHIKWRLYNENNVQCLLCGAMWQKNRKIRDPLKVLWEDAKSHSKRQKREFTISVDDIRKISKIQENKCCLTGIEFSEKILPSLDRKDSSKGYVLENIQLVLKQVNVMKSNFNQIDFIYLCKLISNHDNLKEEIDEKVI